MRIPSAITALLWASLGLASVGAQDATATPTPAITSQLDTVTVSGLQPGPGLWRVSSGEHEMWILGTVAPHPKRMQWDATAVEEIIAESQEVITSSGFQVGSKMNIFRQMMLIPSLLKARKNPSKEKLAEILPAPLYARWQVLSKRYLGRGKGPEKFRPIFAAQKLYAAALDDTALSNTNIVAPVAAKAAKRHKVKYTQPMVSIEVKDMKGLVRDFSNSSLDDIECFEKTLTHVEQDLPTMRARANAWAAGDLDRLRALPYTEQYGACLTSLFEAPSLRKYGFVNIEQRADNAWLEAAETALKTNRSTFAMLPMSELLRTDGLVATLRSKGYVVEAPGKESPDLNLEAAPASAP